MNDPNVELFIVLLATFGVVFALLLVVTKIRFELRLVPKNRKDYEVPGREVVSEEEAEGVEVEEDLWLSASGKLHNSLCRWYQNGEGEIWDGEAPYENCRTCGGDTPIVRRWNVDDE